jgi:hypothetical protein
MIDSDEPDFPPTPEYELQPDDPAAIPELTDEEIERLAAWALSLEDCTSG